MQFLNLIYWHKIQIHLKHFFFKRNLYGLHNFKIAMFILYSKNLLFSNCLVELKYFMSNGASLTSYEEGACLALVDHPYNDGVTIKMPYGVDVLHRPASHPIFSYCVG